ncbi:hypothetical protein ACIQMJ_17370 [Actinosynnema sp. NPDC091369]
MARSASSQADAWFSCSNSAGGGGPGSRDMSGYSTAAEASARSRYQS